MRSVRAQEWLEKDGLVERLKLDGSRVTNFLRITEAGTALAETLLPQSETEIQNDRDKRTTG